jgi:hypothetical protein
MVDVLCYADVRVGLRCGCFDDCVITFESALASVVEWTLSNDYDYVEVTRGLSHKGRSYRKYVISVDNGDD